MCPNPPHVKHLQAELSCSIGRVMVLPPMVVIIGASWPFPDDLTIMLALEVSVLAGFLTLLFGTLYYSGQYDNSLVIPFNRITPVLDCQLYSGLLTTLVVMAVSLVAYCSDTSLKAGHKSICG
jgi:hypothetical protein